MPDAHCLNKAIPEIGAFNERLKYLEEEITIHQILSKKTSIDSIFTKLLDIDKIKRNCLRLKRRSKKNPRV